MLDIYHKHVLLYAINHMKLTMPYATQYTNPQRVTAGGHVISQADPNGLFSPGAAEGTWVMCLNEQTQQPDVVYVEPRIVVLPWPRRAAQ